VAASRECGGCQRPGAVPTLITTCTPAVGAARRSTAPCRASTGSGGDCPACVPARDDDVTEAAWRHSCRAAVTLHSHSGRVGPWLFCAGIDDGTASSSRDLESEGGAPCKRRCCFAGPWTGGTVTMVAHDDISFGINQSAPVHRRRRSYFLLLRPDGPRMTTRIHLHNTDGALAGWHFGRLATAVEIGGPRPSLRANWERTYIGAQHAAPFTLMATPLALSTGGASHFWLQRFVDALLIGRFIVGPSVLSQRQRPFLVCVWSGVGNRAAILPQAVRWSACDTYGVAARSASSRAGC
jgi:hypothetical protein